MSTVNGKEEQLEKNTFMQDMQIPYRKKKLRRRQDGKKFYY